MSKRIPVPQFDEHIVNKYEEKIDQVSVVYGYDAEKDEWLVGNTEELQIHTVKFNDDTIDGLTWMTVEVIWEEGQNEETADKAVYKWLTNG